MSVKLSCEQKVYYKLTGNECIAGKSYVSNLCGKFYLYMGDDMRKTPSTQIIVTNLGGGDLHFLGIECKNEIEILTHSF